ncbi:MAG: GNAT family N-acetyltransferase [Rhodobacteraceae bacterium]|jgi:GNAT superfamily N-acetyltransferase|nr:GNAT family N-acetyltransferase [Paracoccaceae bacterium]
MTEVTFRDFRAGDAPWLVDLHGRLYAEEAGFDDSFGPLVAGILRDYLATRDRTVERAWIAEDGGLRLGSIFCVRGPEGRAKLRLFLLAPEARGRGLGRRMLDLCLRHARDRGFPGLTLWTHESHEAACALYRAAGLRVTRSVPVRSFGQDLIEQTWAIDF